MAPHCVSNFAVTMPCIHRKKQKCGCQANAVSGHKGATARVGVQMSFTIALKIYWSL